MPGHQVTSEEPTQPTVTSPCSEPETAEIDQLIQLPTTPGLSDEQTSEKYSLMVAVADSLNERKWIPSEVVVSRQGVDYLLRIYSKGSLHLEITGEQASLQDINSSNSD